MQDTLIRLFQLAIDFGQVSLVLQASTEDRAFVFASAVVENDRQNLAPTFRFLIN